MWRAGENRAGRRVCSLVTNCLRTIDKKVDDSENQSWVKVEFQKFACQEACCMVLKGEEKSTKGIRTNEPSF